MEKIRKFLQGKKTYISAAALALVAILGWWLGAVDNTNASALLCAAGALAGLGAKSQRTAEAVLVALGNLRDAQDAHARGQKVDLFKLAQQIGVQVIPGIVPISAVPGEQPYPHTASFAVPFSSVAAPGTILPNAWNPLCIYCGQSISANGGACTGKNNPIAPDTSGVVCHVFVVQPGAETKS
jgi:hypothetical protein